MENREALSEPLTTGVYELPGEPIILINGVPDAAPKDPDFTASNDKTEAETPRITGFGEWLEGREVRKFFGGKYYPGTVTEYDKETGWYRVVYEDGDFEDLEWHELREVLQPLDVSVPLRTLALRIIRKIQKSNLSSGKKKGGTGKKRGRPRKVVLADSTGLTQPLNNNMP
ncbi:hypothetical protein Droror1_Dr00008721 [Drosera rotundifolia]